MVLDLNDNINEVLVGFFIMNEYLINIICILLCFIWRVLVLEINVSNIV